MACAQKRQALHLPDRQEGTARNAPNLLKRAKVASPAFLIPDGSSAIPRHGYAAVCTSAARWLTGPKATVERRSAYENAREGTDKGLQDPAKGGRFVHFRPLGFMPKRMTAFPIWRRHRI